MDDRKQHIVDAEMYRAMLEKAAEDGAKKALAAIGLHDEDAANDVHDLRQVMADWRAMKRGVLTALGNTIVLGLLALIGTGLWWHFRKGP